MFKFSEDQTKFLGSHDETKAEMMKDLHEAQDEIEKLTNQAGQLKSKNETLTTELEDSQNLCERLKAQYEKADKKYEETKVQLREAEDLADRLQAAQILSGNVESKFSDMQKESKIEMERILDNHNKELEKLREELKKSHTEHTSLESVLEEQQNELAQLQDQLREEKEQSSNLLVLNQKIEKSEKEKERLEEQIRSHTSQNSDTSKTISDLEDKISELLKTNDLLALDVQKLSKSLDSKDQQLKEAEDEKNLMLEEVQALQNATPSDSVSIFFQ